MMEGLASSMTQSTEPQMAQQTQAPQQDAEMQMLQQIVELLMEGVDPEELVKQGVPPELIMQAIEIIEQQMMDQEQQASARPQQEPEGLAQSMTMPR